MFLDTGKDLEAVRRANEEKDQEDEHELMLMEVQAEHELELLDMKRDYYTLVNLVNRFGPCPGHVYCVSKFPGQGYKLYLQANACTLVYWWRRLRIQKFA